MSPPGRREHPYVRLGTRASAGRLAAYVILTQLLVCLDADCAGVMRMQTWFGPGVRSIVEGETRFSKIGNYKEASPEEPIDLKALDLQQLFLAMTEEVMPCFL